MKDPLIVRVLIPLGIAITLFFVVDFVVTVKALTRSSGEDGAEKRRRRNTKVLGLAGILLVTLLSMVAAVTFTYRSEVSKRRVQEQEALNPHDPRPRQDMRRQVAFELLAVLVPVLFGSLSGLVLRQVERTRLSKVESRVPASGESIAPR